MSIWVWVLFIHILGAALWVGGQLALSLIVLPTARRLLTEEDRLRVLTPVGKRFGILTLAAMLPVQVATGVALAVHNGVTWRSLVEPGYGLTLTVKLALVVVVMAAAGVHGLLSVRQHPVAARVVAMFGLVCSVAILLFAAALGTGWS
ncbi:MAG TPA: hypothetical protein VF054_08400 [Micromonosporaceae bacterium]